MGLDNPWDIQAHDMRERLNGAKSKAVDAIYEFAEPGQLLSDPASLKIAAHWNAATASSFRRIS